MEKEDIPVIGLNFRTRKPRPYNNNHSLGIRFPDDLPI